MIKLLNAGFTRLRKNKAFWIWTIFSICLASCMTLINYSDMKKFGDVIEIGQLMLNYPTMIGIIIAIFTSLFLGVEYSDGAIRNKIIIGHKRINIYLSNFIIITATSLFQYIIYLIIILSLGAPLFGMGTLPIQTLIVKVLLMCAVIITYSSICTFIAIECSNKTLTAVINIMSIFTLLIVATYCYSRLGTPPYIEVAKINDKNSGNYEITQEPNPKYPTEEEKKVYQTLLNVNPAGQTFQVGEKNDGLEILPVYSLGIIIVSTTLGLVLFEQKNLK